MFEDCIENSSSDYQHPVPVFDRPTINSVLSTPLTPSDFLTPDKKPIKKSILTSPLTPHPFHPIFYHLLYSSYLFLTSEWDMTVKDLEIETNDEMPYFFNYPNLNVGKGLQIETDGCEHENSSFYQSIRASFPLLDLIHMIIYSLMPLSPLFPLTGMYIIFLFVSFREEKLDLITFYYYYNTKVKCIMLMNVMKNCGKKVF
jgi:hypothetical protein